MRSSAGLIWISSTSSSSGRMETGEGGVWMRPCARAHIALPANRHGEFCNVVAVRRLENGNNVGVAGRQVQLLDVDVEFLGQFARRFRAFGAFLDMTDSQIGPTG